jgi:hypothetical protein
LSGGTSIKDLVVVDFPKSEIGDKLRRWRAERNKFPEAVTCARQVWWGLERDFTGFDQTIDMQKCKVFRGPEAYQFLLRLNLGLESTREAETNVKGQFVEKWEEFKAQTAKRAKIYEPIAQGIMADTRLVSGMILSEYKPHRQELVARDLSGMKEGDDVLIIGGVNDFGRMTYYTEGMIKVFFSKHGKKDTSGVLIVTTPNDDDLEKIKAEVSAMSCVNPYRINFVSFHNLDWAIEQSKRVFLTVDMGKAPEAEAHIIDTWKSEERTDNTFTAVKGQVSTRGQSSELWKTANLERFVAPEAVQAEMTERARYNKGVLGVSDALMEFCAEERMNARRASKYVVDNQFLSVIPGDAPGAMPEPA